MNADKFYEAMKEALNAFDLKWNEKDKMIVNSVSENKCSFTYNGRIYGVIDDPRKEQKSAEVQRLNRIIWARNPCSLKNSRGHRSCSLCDSYAKKMRNEA